MLKLKVHPSNLPIVAPEKKPSVFKLDASCLWTDNSDVLAAWISELSAELVAVDRLGTIDIRRWWLWDVDSYASKLLRFYDRLVELHNSLEDQHNMQVFLTEWLLLFPGSPTALVAFTRNFSIAFLPRGLLQYQITDPGFLLWLITKKWRVRLFHLFRTMSGEFLEQHYGTTFVVCGLRGWIKCCLVCTFATCCFWSSFGFPHQNFATFCIIFKGNVSPS